MATVQLHSMVFGKCGFEDRTLVEICGPPKSGKSLVFQQLIAHCLLPLKFGGRECRVYLIILSHKITKESLTKIVRAELRKFFGEGEPPAEEHLVEIAKECIARVSFMKCFSSTDVKYALFNIPYETSRNRSMEVVAIDTLSEFYWLDAADRKNLTKYRHYRASQFHLKQICNDALVCGMYTVDSSYVEPRYNEKIKAVKINYIIKISKPRGGLVINGMPASFSNGIIEIKYTSKYD